LRLPDAEMLNRAKPVPDAFTHAELSAEVARLLKPDNIKAEFAVVYQTCENLRKCCPDHAGDWYFTGNYPTRGGNRFVNKVILDYVKKKGV
jgi:amidophosphoribosyltransferase